MFKRVMHPTDFSKASSSAFAQAVEIARANRAELTIVHALPATVVPGADGYLPPSTYDDIARSNRVHAERQIKTLAARAKKRGVRVTTQLLDGAPWEAITRAARARRAGVVVMGTHGRNGLAKLFLGSVAERVIGKAPCPVLTVRGRRSPV